MKLENETKRKNEKEKTKLNVRYEKKKRTIRKKNEIKRTIRKKNRNFYCLAGLAARFRRLFRFCLVFRICLVVGKLRFLLRVCLDSKKVNIFNINLKNHLNVFNYYLAYPRIES